jgi:peptidoglycan/xylan/chitin deacetylase (PgdA/CDA1 family)
MVQRRVRFALKVDVDTFRGMREGLPRLLDLLAARRIRASIFVSMGPDHSGRAIRRVVTKRGFLPKMLRTRAVSLYGPRTLLYGTLLPGPRIAERNPEPFRRIESEGHEVGVHGWDHVRWQDGLPKFSEETIARELARAFEAFVAMTGREPLATAAPGWIASARSLAVQDDLGLLYSSDVRGQFPFLPRVGARVFRTPQVPTTLPTLDEMIGREELFARRAPASGAGDEGWINAWLVSEAVRQAGARPGAPVVHTIHTEVEGMSRAALFADLLDRLLAEGARFVRLDEIVAAWAGGAEPDRSIGSLGDIGVGRVGEAAAQVRAGSQVAAGDAGRGAATGGIAAAAGNKGVGVDSGGGAEHPRLPVCAVLDGTLPGRSGTLAVQGV